MLQRGWTVGTLGKGTYKPITTEQTLSDSTYVRHLEWSIHKKRKWLLGPGNGELVFHGTLTSSSAVMMKKVLDIDGGDGCTIIT